MANDENNFPSAAVVCFSPTAKQTPTTAGLRLDGQGSVSFVYPFEGINNK